MYRFLLSGKRWYECFHNRLVTYIIGSTVESWFPESTMKMFKKPEPGSLALLSLCGKLGLEAVELP